METARGRDADFRSRPPRPRYPGLERVHLCAFTRGEQARLAAAARLRLDPNAAAEREAKRKAAAEEKAAAKVAAAEKQAAAAAAADAPLPEGWKEYVVASSGKKYYHHKASDTTQWKRP